MNWSSFDSILFTLDKVILITYFVILVLAVLVERKVSSFVITVIVLTVANSVMTSLSPVMYQFSSQPGLIAKFSWYAGFALIDMMALFLLYKFHQLLNQNVCYVAQLVGMLFLAFATLQTARFIDRFVFHTDLLQQVYKYAIPVLNVTLVPIIVFFLVVRDETNTPLYSHGYCSMIVIFTVFILLINYLAVFSYRKLQLLRSISQIQAEVELEMHAKAHELLVRRDQLEVGLVKDAFAETDEKWKGDLAEYMEEFEQEARLRSKNRLNRV